MSHYSLKQIKTLSVAISDIYIDDPVESGPRAIADVLRPFMIELKRSRIAALPMRTEILDRYRKSVDFAAGARR